MKKLKLIFMISIILAIIIAVVYYTNTHNDEYNGEEVDYIYTYSYDTDKYALPLGGTSIFFGIANNDLFELGVLNNTTFYDVVNVNNDNEISILGPTADISIIGDNVGNNEYDTEYPMLKDSSKFIEHSGYIVEYDTMYQYTQSGNGQDVISLSTGDERYEYSLEGHVVSMNYDSTSSRIYYQLFEDEYTYGYLNYDESTKRFIPSNELMSIDIEPYENQNVITGDIPLQSSMIIGEYIYGIPNYPNSDSPLVVTTYEKSTGKLINKSDEIFVEDKGTRNYIWNEEEMTFSLSSDYNATIYDIEENMFYNYTFMYPDEKNLVGKSDTSEEKSMIVTVASPVEIYLSGHYSDNTLRTYKFDGNDYELVTTTHSPNIDDKLELFNVEVLEQ